jgi:hypothetical protein
VTQRVRSECKLAMYYYYDDDGEHIRQRYHSHLRKPS